MSSLLQETVLSEPSGRSSSAVMFAGSLIFLGIYVYFDVLHNGSSISSLVTALGFALSGSAEALPRERRRFAGVLRLTAILVILGLILTTMLAPELTNPQ